MGLTVHNPFGFDEADLNEETSASRIGHRLKVSRIEKGLTQSELGQAMGLSGDRIQKYENGVRKPRFDMLKNFARVLDVETTALLDPVVTNHIGAMYAFFEMEEFHNLEVKRDGNKYSLQFGNGISGTMNEYLKEWYDERELIRTCLEYASEEEQQTFLKMYQKWKKTFPRSLSDKAEKSLQKETLQNMIAKLQTELDNLDK